MKASVPGVNLDGLRDFDLDTMGNIQSGGAGVPLEIALELIDPDPDNARGDIDEESLKELAESIRADRVREPVSVRPMNEHGRYVLHSGERRWRASKLAGKTTIPAFVDADGDAFSRLTVNIQREDLAALDIAKALAANRGAMNGVQLAKKIGKSQSYITQHLALLELPAALRALYDNDVCRTPGWLYDLLRLWRKDAPAVESAVKDATEITAGFIARLSGEINAKNTAVEDDGADDSPGEPEAEPETHTPDKAPAPRVKIVVKHAGKRYQLVGNFSTTHVPSAPGLVFVKKGSDEPIEVDVKGLELDAILVQSPKE